MEERLQKILSRAGITSRRKAEGLILSGRVKVDGQIVTTLGTKVDPKNQRIEVDGKPIKISPPVYLMLYKPRFYVTTLYDPQGRPKVTDLLKNVRVRVYPIGRLDFDAEGLLLFTNDGEFANQLIHPRYKVPKTYEVWVRGIPDKKALNLLRTGVKLEEGLTLPARVKIKKKMRDKSLLEMIIYEGRYRQIKRMCASVGYPVLHLKRTKIGLLTLGRLKPGQYRYLTPREVSALIRTASRPSENP